VVYSKAEAADFFKAQEEATNLPYIYLSDWYFYFKNINVKAWIRENFHRFNDFARFHFCIFKILAYDEEISDAGSVEYAKVKPRKVIEAMKVFSDPLTGTSTLRTSMLKRGSEKTFIASMTLRGFTFAYKAEAADFFKAQEEATNLPYIYLSAGVSAKLFQEQ
jgi:tagatose-1,6-bisphosphate aldolase